MGFFSLKAKCAICGREVGLNRFQIIGPDVPKGMELWKCPQCARKGGVLRVHPDGKVELISQNEINNAAFNELKQKVSGSQSQVTGADEIKKYKELLDCGAITQEEFDAKKKQILGL